MPLLSGSCYSHGQHVFWDLKEGQKIDVTFWGAVIFGILWYHPKASNIRKCDHYRVICTCRILDPASPMQGIFSGTLHTFPFYARCWPDHVQHGNNFANDFETSIFFSITLHGNPCIHLELLPQLCCKILI